MKPIKFRDANTTFVGFGVGELPAFVGGDMIVTCWRPTWRERVKVLFSGCVWCAMLTDVCPPVLLDVGRSFVVDCACMLDGNEDRSGSA